MNSNNKYDFYNNSKYFLFANAVLLAVAIVIVSIFGFRFETDIAQGKLLLATALVTLLSLISVFVYVKLRYDTAKAFCAVLVGAHNVLLSTVFVALIRIPVTENLVAGFALVVGLTTVAVLSLTQNIKNENLKKVDYSEIIKNQLSQNLKQITVFGAIVVAILFLSLIIASKEMFGFARLFFVMVIVVLYSTFTIILPIWCFLSSKIKNVKKAKVDENVENQKVVKAVQTESEANENE